MNASPYSSPYLGPWLPVVTLGLQKKISASTVCFYRVFAEVIKRLWTSRNTKMVDYLSAIPLRKSPDYSGLFRFCGSEKNSAHYPGWPSVFRSGADVCCRLRRVDPVTKMSLIQSDACEPFPVLNFCRLERGGAVLRRHLGQFGVGANTTSTKAACRWTGRKP